MAQMSPPEAEPLGQVPQGEAGSWIQAFKKKALSLVQSLIGLIGGIRVSQGMKSFLIYEGALIFLLTSLRFVLDLSNWPLANLFLGALAFRGILTLEKFLNGGDVQKLLSSFLGDRIPVSYITPMVFCVFAALICLYTGLNWLTRKIRRAGDGY
jgi:hypothetical protein